MATARPDHLQCRHWDREPHGRSGQDHEAEVLVEGLDRIVLGVDDEGVSTDSGCIGAGDLIDEPRRPEALSLGRSRHSQATEKDCGDGRRPGQLLGLVRAPVRQHEARCGQEPGHDVAPIPVERDMPARRASCCSVHGNDGSACIAAMPRSSADPPALRTTRSHRETVSKDNGGALAPASCARDAAQPRTTPAAPPAAPPSSARSPDASTLMSGGRVRSSTSAQLAEDANILRLCRASRRLLLADANLCGVL